MIDASLVAEHFPDAPAGYFDHAAVSTVPRAVRAAVAGVATALEGGMTGSAAWHELTDRALPLIADEIGSDPVRTIALGNTSTAVNAVARAVPLGPGDEVLTFADDFPSPRMPWPPVAGARVREIPPGPADERTSALVEAITSATRVVSITHVHASTGTVVDLARVAAACRDADALLVVDGAQAAGLLPGGAAEADVYIGASYKWLLAGFGLAVVATSARFDEAAVPGLIGYLNAPPSPRLDVGHANLFGLAALQAAAEVRRAVGLETILAHTRACVAEITRAADELGYARTSSHAGAGILGLAVHDAAAMADALRARDLHVAVRSGSVRISPYLTTTSHDLDRLTAALADLAPAQRIDA